MPVEDHNLLELADENYHLSSDLVRSSDGVPTTHNSVSRSLTAGEQLANQLLHVNEDKKDQKQLVDTVMSTSLSTTIKAFLSSRQDHTDINSNAASVKVKHSLYECINFTIQKLNTINFIATEICLDKNVALVWIHPCISYRLVQSTVTFPLLTWLTC